MQPSHPLSVIAALASVVVFSSSATAATVITTTKGQSFVFNTAFGTNPGFDMDNIAVTAVPEPGASLLAASGVLLLARRRRP